MFRPDDFLWGLAPGQGPELRNDVERDTTLSLPFRPPCVRTRSH